MSEEKGSSGGLIVREEGEEVKEKGKGDFYETS